MQKKTSGLQAKINTITASEGFKSFTSSLMAILFGLLVGFVMLIFANSKNAVDGFMALISGGFKEGMSSIGNVLYLATPIVMTGLSVGFAFKTGLFNIGGSGQYLVGAFVGIYISATWEFIPTQIRWIVALMGSAIAGALWAFVPGLLKATRNVNEVITAIMMNYIGMYLVNYLIPLSPIYDSTRNQTVPPRSFIPKLGLDKIFPDCGISAAILITIACVVLVHVILNKTTFGFELKACGYNQNAGKYAGINEKKCIILSMVIAGALSGLAGGLAHLANTGKYISVVDVLPNEGFDGIAVALLGLSNPGGIFLSGTFIAYLRQGGFYMQRFGYVTEVINIIIAAIIYCSAFSAAFKNIIAKIKAKKNNKEQKKVAGEDK